MKVIPAIDIRGGRCVRLFQGDYNQETVYADDPAEQALRFEDQGATFLHVVDLDGAKAGEVANLAAVRSIAERTRLEIEFGGGLRSLPQLAGLESVGVRRFILGSGLIDEKFRMEALGKYGPDRVIPGVDIKDGQLALKGWTELSKFSLGDFLRRLETDGFREIIFTNIRRDGAMTGPDLALLDEILGVCGLSVIVSGGFSRLQDVVEIKNLKNNRVKGIILGKALYEKKIDLAEALRLAGTV